MGQRLPGFSLQTWTWSIPVPFPKSLSWFHSQVCSPRNPDWLRCLWILQMGNKRFCSSLLPCVSRAIVTPLPRCKPTTLTSARQQRLAQSLSSSTHSHRNSSFSGSWAGMEQMGGTDPFYVASTWRPCPVWLSPTSTATAPITPHPLCSRHTWLVTVSNTPFLISPLGVISASITDFCVCGLW
jgi:hypothetical protein